ncbi:prolyl oligopeptidase family serine peptidase [Histomonas meleagridis]|uniref:prolyl oligopeptidase family serine peptidase n=1 Tax=Histomonas meleagridis TaxID=135588 RepID=UPI003559EB79|nr:prolyl oligopeptidase family serine peptidase [Histomonas meleagridis]KAH0803920.1 prolyl oligopeptidase family serine peptidase [Histomonas meleagridis]
MPSISLLVENRNFFASALLVPGHWSSEKMKVLVNDTFWVIVSRGDAKASAGLNEAMGVLEGIGANITRATWDGKVTTAEQEEEVKKAVEKNTKINYITLKNGTVAPPEHPNMNHQYTWRIAYTIEGVREWLFKQKRQSN